MNIITKCEPLKFVSHDGRKVENRLRSYIRHLNKRGETWGGTEEEFRAWALSRVRDWLTHVTIYQEVDL